MNYQGAGLHLKTAPTSEPVDVTQAQEHSRIFTTEDVGLLEALITAARQEIEVRTGRALVTQTWQMLMDTWPSGSRIVIPKPPLQEIVSVTYVDSAGATHTMAAADYDVEFAATAPVLNPYHPVGAIVLAYGKSWPTETLRPAAPITVEFKAGYGTAAQVPVQLKQAMLLLVGHWYENREAAGDAKYANGLQHVPFGVSSLCAPFKVWSF